MIGSQNCYTILNNRSSGILLLNVVEEGFRGTLLSKASSFTFSFICVIGHIHGDGGVNNTCTKEIIQRKLPTCTVKKSKWPNQTPPFPQNHTPSPILNLLYPSNILDFCMSASVVHHHFLCLAVIKHKVVGTTCAY